MKNNLMLITVIALLLFSSCSKDNENISPQHVPSTTIENAETEGTLQRKKTKAALIAVPSLSPCGYGFRVTLSSLGTGLPITNTTATSPYHYEIYDGNTMVDNGDIAPGPNPHNTDWILSPCTNYEFRFWGYGGGTSGPITNIQTVTSDGCGGVFIC